MRIMGIARKTPPFRQASYPTQLGRVPGLNWNYPFIGVFHRRIYGW